MADFSRLARLLHRIFLEDLLLKLFCLALAVLMWFYIDSELMGQRDLEVQLQPAQLKLPKGLELAPARSLPRFTVKVRGPRQKLALMTPDNVAVSRNFLAKLRPGKNRLPVERTDLLAPGFEVLEITPKEASIEVVATVSVPKDVAPRFRGEQKPDYVRDRPEVEPKQVTIQVAENEQDSFKYVNTEEIDISEADQDVKREVGIVPFVEVDGFRIPFRCDEKVTVTVPIRLKGVPRTITRDVRAIVPPDAAMMIEPREIQVEVLGEERDLTADEVMSRIYLYVKWPAEWERSRQSGNILGPLTVPVEVSAPPRMQVRGLKNGALPKVEIRGIMLEAPK
jgi:hypothetical protein